MKDMNTKRLRLVFLALGLILFTASALYAQFVTSANATLGVRQFNGTLGSSKFTEYRDLPTGLFMDVFSINFMNSDYTNVLSIWGSHVGQRDQNVAAQLGVRGKFKLELEWEQTPHNYTNTARTVFNGAGGAVLTMPVLLRSQLRTLLNTDISPAPGLQFDTLAVTTLISGVVNNVDIVSRREKAKAAFAYSPTEEIGLKVQYSNERRSGTKPLGVNFAFNPIEVPEPTAYRTQEALTNLEYATRDWNIQLGYSASIFTNKNDVLIWDNPFRETDPVNVPSRADLICTRTIPHRV